MHAESYKLVEIFKFIYSCKCHKFMEHLLCMKVYVRLLKDDESIALGLQEFKIW